MDFFFRLELVTFLEMTAGSTFREVTNFVETPSTLPKPLNKRRIEAPTELPLWKKLFVWTLGSVVFRVTYSRAEERIWVLVCRSWIFVHLCRAHIYMYTARGNAPPNTLTWGIYLLRTLFQAWFLVIVNWLPWQKADENEFDAHYVLVATQQASSAEYRMRIQT